MAKNGLITTPSRYGPEDKMNRLEAAVRAKGMTVFAHVDHAAGAAAAGMSLWPTDRLIFGNAKGGTPIGPDTLSHRVVFARERHAPLFQVDASDWYTVTCVAGSIGSPHGRRSNIRHASM
jgi:hypothetical protein